MNQPISGLFDLLNILDSTCHPEAEFVLYGENLVFEFKGLSTSSGVLYSSLADAKPTPLTDETTRSKIEHYIQTYLSIVIIIYSILDNLEPTTQKPITEISGYSVLYENGAISHLKLASEEIQKVALINPLTGQPKQPEPNEIFLSGLINQADTFIDSDNRPLLGCCFVFVADIKKSAGSLRGHATQQVDYYANKEK